METISRQYNVTALRAICRREGLAKPYLGESTKPEILNWLEKYHPERCQWLTQPAAEEPAKPQTVNLTPDAKNLYAQFISDAESRLAMETRGWTDHPHTLTDAAVARQQKVTELLRQIVTPLAIAAASVSNNSMLEDLQLRLEGMSSAISAADEALKAELDHDYGILIGDGRVRLVLRETGEVVTSETKTIAEALAKREELEG